MRIFETSWGKLEDLRKILSKVSTMWPQIFIYILFIFSYYLLRNVFELNHQTLKRCFSVLFSVSVFSV